MDKPGDWLSVVTTKTVLLGPVHWHTQMTCLSLLSVYIAHLGRLATCCFTASEASMWLAEHFVYKQIGQGKSQPVVKEAYFSPALSCQSNFKILRSNWNADTNLLKIPPFLVYI